MRSCSSVSTMTIHPERTPEYPIIGADISPKAIAIAEKNIKQAGVGRWVDIQIKPIAKWEEAPAAGILVSNPLMASAYRSTTWHRCIPPSATASKMCSKAIMPGLSAIRMNTCGISVSPLTQKSASTTALWNANCANTRYSRGDYKSFRSEGNRLNKDTAPQRGKADRRKTDDEWRRDARKKGFGGRDGDNPRFRKGADRPQRKPNALEEKYRAKPLGRKKNATTVKSAPDGFGRKPSFGETFRTSR